MITELQTKALVFCVQMAKANGGLIPGGRVLAEFLHPKAATDAKIRAANSLIERLARTHKAFIRPRGKPHWKLNTTGLVTEPTTAAYLVIFHKLCSASDNAESSLSKETLHAALVVSQTTPSRFEVHNLEEVLTFAKREQYVIEVDATVPGEMLRIGPALKEQLRYLERLQHSPKEKVFIRHETL